MKSFFLLLLLFCSFELAASEAFINLSDTNRKKTELKISGIFSDGMVLQQNSNLKIWGWANANEKVVVKIPAIRFKTTVQANDSGNWSINFDSPKADGKPVKIIVKSNRNTIVLNDILFGEVWLGSGQSNMEFPLKNTDNAEVAISLAKYQQIRFITVPFKTIDTPQEDIEGQWQKCTPETVADFSGVGYYFAKNLHEQLDVPIGIIISAYGGTPIEAWMDKKTLTEEVPVTMAAYDTVVKKWENGGAAKYHKELLKYEEKAVRGSDSTEKPQIPFGPEHFQHPAGLYNGMIHPLINFKIRGFIWYQGEANSWRAKEYLELFPAMVDSWRRFWSETLPFFYVQIAPSTYYDETSFGIKDICPELQESQRLSLNRIPKSGMAVSLDGVTDYDDLHSKNKKDIGDRLAALALDKTYKRELVSSGPLFKEMAIEGDKLRLYFYNAEDGLELVEANNNQFEIAGEDGVYYPAEVVVQGETLVLKSSKTPNPTNARYAWSNTAEATFFNKNGFPASVFRTDNSKWETADSGNYF